MRTPPTVVERHAGLDSAAVTVQITGRTSRPHGQPTRGANAILLRQGNATVVRDFLVTAGPELLPFVLAPEGTVDPRILADLLGIRGMLLAWTAREAARVPDRDLTRLEAIVAGMERGPGPAALQVLDFDFFQELVRLTGNRVLGLLTNTIRQVYLERPELFAALYQPGFDCGPHRRALTALAAGDGAAAAAAMEDYAQRAVPLVALAAGR
jgi:DNA-binding FadR family transcriptional regulator